MVVDFEKNRIPNVTITVFNLQSDEIVTFCITDIKGYFTFNINSTFDSLKLEISKIGFQKRSLFLKNLSQNNLSFSLKNEEIELPEVIVNDERPLYSKGDTLSYNPKSFLDGSDRVLIDVIKKLPGIIVTESGQILYQNKAISKFYIDGRDLLNDRYNIATNNLPIDIVNKIQILENHQPIKILEKINKTERAALNIVLDSKAKSKLLGNLNTGIGTPKIIGQADLSLLKFTNKLQFINSFKNNNNGILLKDEIFDHGINSSDFGNGLVKESLSIIQTPLPLINSNRYLFNNSNLFYGNYLKDIDTSLTMKINFSLLRDQIKSLSSSFKTFYFPDTSLIINEVQSNENGNFQLNTGIILESNNEKLYFKNNLRFNNNFNNSFGDISSQYIKQTLRTDNLLVSNNFDGFFKFNKNLIVLSSSISYSYLPEKLTIVPGKYEDYLNQGNKYYSLIQNFSTKNLYTENSLGLTKIIKKISISNKVGMKLNFDEIKNKLQLTDSLSTDILKDTFNNSIKRDEISFYLFNSINYISNKFNFTFSTNIYNTALINREFLKSKNQFFIINPKLNLIYFINSIWQANLSASLNENIFNTYNPTYRFNNYRILSANNLPFQKIETKGILGGLGYKNIIKGLFYNLSINYFENESNSISINQFNGILNIHNLIFQNNPYNSFRFSNNISKYLPDFHTTFNIGLIYDISTQRQERQGLINKNINSSVIISSSINSKFGDIISIDYDVEFAKYKNSLNNKEETFVYKPILSLKQTFVAKYFFSKGMNISFVIDNYTNKQKDEKRFNNSFIDLKVQKRIKKPKIDIAITATNLYNLKSYNTFNVSNNTLINDSYNIRPRSLFFNVSFQF